LCSVHARRAVRLSQSRTALTQRAAAFQIAERPLVARPQAVGRAAPRPPALARSLCACAAARPRRSRTSRGWPGATRTAPDAAARAVNHSGTRVPAGKQTHNMQRGTTCNHHATYKVHLAYNVQPPCDVPATWRYRTQRARRRASSQADRAARAGRTAVTAQPHTGGVPGKLQARVRLAVLETGRLVPLRGSMG
jgi:hypothetical protein